MKDYSCMKHRVVYLKGIKRYTANSDGSSLTNDLLQANHWYIDIPVEDIMKHLRPDLRDQAEIFVIIISAMIL